MLIYVLGILSFILALFLSLYVIRSIIFLLTSKTAIKEYNKYLLYNLHSPTIKPSSEIMTENKYQAGSNVKETLDNKETYSNRQSFKRKTYATNDTMNTDIKAYGDVYPFVSILVATRNESAVIDNLMRSCSALTYDRSRFEIIVVDDSTDDTLLLLKQWEHKISNLKLIHRSERIGWKGGALNLALKNMNETSTYALVVDADNLLVSDILERFVSCFLEQNKKCTYVIQGFPISMINSGDYFYDIGNNNPHRKIRNHRSGWVANAIDFRLTQRNIVEFLAKDDLKLPIQITGSLFMIRSEIIKAIGFSNDLTEDWDLTLDLNFSPKMQIYDSNNNCSDYKRKGVSFNPLLISYCEATTKIEEYFKQRMRVSEGHTRGFRKRIWTILTGRIPVRDKIEFLFSGLHYAKFIAVFALIIIDVLLVPQILWNDNNLEPINYVIKFSLIMQLSNVLISIMTGITGLSIYKYIRNYGKKHVFYLLLLNLFTIPAFVAGSLLGFSRNKGIFYDTKRKMSH